jgi:hypothetical protein
MAGFLATTLQVSPVMAADPVQYDDNTHEVVTLDGPTGVGTRITGIADGELSASSTDAVTGSQLYSLSQQFSNFESALSENNSTIARTQTAVNQLKTNVITLTSTVNTIKTQVEAGFNITVDGARVKNVNPDSNYFNFTAGDGIAITADGESIKIASTATVSADGQIAENNEGLISGGTAYTELRPADGNYVAKDSTTAANLSALDAAVKANADAIEAIPEYTAGNEIEISNDHKISVKPTGTIASDSEGVVTGKTVYEEVRPTSNGTYVSTSNSAGANLTALDAAVKANADAIEAIPEYTAGDHIEISDDYKISAKMDGQIASGNTGLVSGGQVFDAIQAEARPAQDGEFVKASDTAGANLTALDAAVKANADAIEAIPEYTAGDHIEISDDYKISAKTDGQIASGDTGLVSGGQVFDAIQAEARPAQDGEFVKASDTAGANLTALDAAVKANADAIEAIPEYTAGNEIEISDDYKISVKPTGTVASDSEGLVTGKTVFTEVRPAQDGEYVKASETTGANLTALDTAVKANADAITELGDGKANVALDNITDGGKSVVRGLAQEAVKVVAGEHTTVTEATDGNAKTYAVNVVSDGRVEDGNTGILTGDTVYNYFQSEGSSFAKTNASNVSGFATEWAEAIGTGTVDDSANNVKLVTGATVYDALNSAVQNIYENFSGTLGNYADKDGGNVTHPETWGEKLGTGAVEENNGKLVTGGTVYSALKDATDSINDSIDTKLDQYALADGSNVYDTETWGEKLGTGVVEEDNGELVTGGTVYTALEDAKSDISDAVDTKLDGYAKVDASNIEGHETEWAEALGTGAVAPANKNLVTGETVYNAITPVQNGTYVTTNNSAGDNLLALDTAVAGLSSAMENVVVYDDASKGTVTLAGGSRGTVIDNVKSAVISKTSMQAVNGAQLWAVKQDIAGFATDIRKNADNISTLNQSVSDALSSVSAVSDLVDSVDNLKADTSLNNLSQQGKNMLNSVVTDAIQDYMAHHGNDATGSANRSTRLGAVNPGANTNYVVYDNADGTSITLEGPTGEGTVISGVADGELSASSTEAVTGAQLYATEQKFNEFQSALSENNSTIARTQTAVNQLKTNYITLNSTVNTIKTQVEAGFNVTIDGAKVKNVNPESNYIDFTAGDGIAITAENEGIKISSTLSADGQIADGDTGMISGGTAYTELRPDDGEYVAKDNTTAENLSALDTAVKENADAIEDLGGEVDDINDALDSKANKDASNVADNTAEWGAAIGTGVVEQGNGELVTGDTVYTEVRPAQDGEYVKADSTTGENLSALDTAVKENADAIEEITDAVDGKANVALDNITDEGKTVIRDLAKESVKVIAGEHTTVTEGTDGNAKTYAVNVTADGQITEGNTGLVDGGTVYQYVQDVTGGAVTPEDLKAYAKKDASNVGVNDSDGDSTEAWGAALGTGTVAENDGKLVTGDTVAKALKDLKPEGVIASDEERAVSGATVYTEVRPAQDGEFVKADKTTAENLMALDEKAKANDEAINEVTEGLDAKANKDASNVADYAEDWAMAIGTGAVAEDDGKLVTGKTVFAEVRPAQDGEYVKASETTGANLLALDTQLKDTASAVEELDTAVEQVATDLDGKANKDASNVAEHTADWGAAIGTGVIEQGNGELVTGGTVFAETRPAQDGEFVKADSTVGENLLTLDSKVSDTASTVEEIGNTVDEIGEAVDNKANKDASNVAEHTAEWGAAIGTGVVEQGNGELVTGGTVYTAIDNAVAGLQNEMDNKANTDMDNLTDAGKTVVRDLAKEAITVKGEGPVTVSESTENDVKVFTVSVATDGEVAEGNEGIVTGGTVYNAITEIAGDIENKADADLGNITDGGKEVIREVVKGDLDKKADKDAGNIETEKWAEKLGIGEVAEGDTNLVTGGTVHEAIGAVEEKVDDKADKDLGNISNDGKEVIREVMKGDLDKKADKDAGNIDAQVWADKLGTGAIEEGDGMLVTGDTVAKALANFEPTDVIAPDNEAGSIRIGGKDKYDGLDAVDISKSDGSSRVLRGVETDPNDPTSAASVEFVNDGLAGIRAGVNQGFAKLDDKINKAGANAAALAGLHPLDFDPDQKFNIAAGVGNYHDATAAAVGLFYRPDDRTQFNIAASLGNGENMISGGVALALDRSSGRYVSRAQLLNLVKNQANEIAQLKDQMNRLSAVLSMNPNARAGFPDVPANHWAREAVETLHGNDMVEGYPDGEFKGDRQMTRYEYAEMLYRTIQKGVKVDPQMIQEYSKELAQVKANANKR